MTTTAPTDRFPGLEAQATRLAAGEVTSVELVDEALRRIEATQPTLNAFRHVRAETARAEARAADDRLRGRRADARCSACRWRSRTTWT